MKYKRINSDRKTVGIQIVFPGNIVVRAPEKMSSKEVEAVIKRKSDWIKEKKKEFSEKLPYTKYEFYDGEKFPYKGRWYRLKILSGKPNLKLYQGKFLVKTENKHNEDIRVDEIKKLFKNWYKNKAEEELVRLAKDKAHILGKDVEIIIKDSKISWGYSKDGKIYLNWRLIMAPKCIQEYVIFHELLHQDMSDHSKLFWSKLDSYIPKRKEYERWLKKHGNRLSI